MAHYLYPYDRLHIYPNPPRAAFSAPEYAGDRAAAVAIAAADNTAGPNGAPRTDWAKVFRWTGNSGFALTVSDAATICAAVAERHAAARTFDSAQERDAWVKAAAAFELDCAKAYARTQLNNDLGLLGPWT